MRRILQLSIGELHVHGLHGLVHSDGKGVVLRRGVGGGNVFLSAVEEELGTGTRGQSATHVRR